MKKPRKEALTLSSFVGNGRAVAILKRAIDQDRLPHAMIFAGPAGVGKCTLALLLAQYLNCASPGPEGACGTCAACDYAGAACTDGPRDCWSKVCTAQKCVAPTCGDLPINGLETDKDCGGSCCAECADVDVCKVASDCGSKLGVDSRCAAGSLVQTPNASSVTS